MPIVTKKELLRKVDELSPERFAQIAPFIEADLDILDELGGLSQEVEAGRRSAREQPILEGRDVFSRIRKDLRQ